MAKERGDVAELSDQELMMRVRDGQLGCMGELFERHHRRLFNFFLRLTGHRQASEDLVQESFIRMLRYRHTFRGDGAFSSWMFSMARNLSATYFRKGLRARLVPPEAAPEPVTDGGQQEALERGEETRLLHAALLRLPADKREVLLLSRFEMMKHRQIAELLGCSVGAVKVRIHRALRQLRDCYHQVSSEASP